MKHKAHIAIKLGGVLSHKAHAVCVLKYHLPLLFLPSLICNALSFHLSSKHDRIQTTQRCLYACALFPSAAGDLCFILITNNARCRKSCGDYRESPKTKK